MFHFFGNEANQARDLLPDKRMFVFKRKLGQDIKYGLYRKASHWRHSNREIYMQMQLWYFNSKLFSPGTVRHGK